MSTTKAKSKLLGKGYHIFTDNWYTKLSLAKELLTKKTFITGTVYKNTKDLSKELKLKVQGREESAYYRHQTNILLVKYSQKVKRKPVYLISTGCNAEDRLITSRHGLQAVKPTLINSYNLNMGGVDNSDKSVYHLSASRTTKKNWKKIFTNLLDIALFDAYVLYKENTDRPMTRQEFHSNIVETLAEEGREVPAVPVLDHTIHKLDHLPGRTERVCNVCANNPTGAKKEEPHSGALDAIVASIPFATANLNITGGPFKEERRGEHLKADRNRDSRNQKLTPLWF